MTRSSSKYLQTVAASPPGSVRIIAGKWRRRRLKLDQQPGLRPTPDRVRETLFSWLTPVVRGSRCLDLFAGSGALGFEAASRGAGHVIMVEKNQARADLLLKHRDDLGASEVKVIHADAIAWLDTIEDVFDIVFLDPPFDGFDLGAICDSFVRNKLLAPSAYVYMETGVKSALPVLPPGWERLRSQRAGQVRYDLAVRILSANST